MPWCFMEKLNTWWKHQTEQVSSRPNNTRLPSNETTGAFSAGFPHAMESSGLSPGSRADKWQGTPDGRQRFSFLASLPWESWLFSSEKSRHLSKCSWNSSHQNQVWLADSWKLLSGGMIFLYSKATACMFSVPATLLPSINSRSDKEWCAYQSTCIRLSLC